MAAAEGAPAPPPSLSTHPYDSVPDLNGSISLFVDSSLYHFFKKHAAGKRPQVNLSDNDDEYVVAKRDGRETNLLYPSSDEKTTLSRTLMRRKSTKKRMKLLR